MRARPPTQQVQGVQRVGDMRARPPTQHVQGVRRVVDMRARPPTQPLQGVRRSVRAQARACAQINKRQCALAQGRPGGCVLAKKGTSGLLGPVSRISEYITVQGVSRADFLSFGVVPLDNHGKPSTVTFKSGPALVNAPAHLRRRPQKPKEALRDQRQRQSSEPRICATHSPVPVPHSASTAPASISKSLRSL